jgi:hypothetical protein
LSVEHDRIVDAKLSVVGLSLLHVEAKVSVAVRSFNIEAQLAAEAAATVFFCQATTETRALHCENACLPTDIVQPWQQQR